MLYVKCRKSFEVRRQNFFITLPCAKIKHMTKFSFAVCQKNHTAKYSLPCAKKNTRQSMTLPCALILPCVFLSTLGKIYVCRVPVNLHSANLGALGKNEISSSVVN